MIVLSTEYYPDNWLDDPYFKNARANELRRSLNTLVEQIEHINKITEGVPMPTTLTDAEFLRTGEKANIIVQWGAFVGKGFQPEHFTNAIYNHLHHHCGFIAHYDRNGFYRTYWNDHITRCAEEDNHQIRSIPATFYGWEDFLRQFNIWDPYTDINTLMMYQLKDALEALKNDLIEEVKALYTDSMEKSYRAYLKETDGLQKQITGLQAKLTALDPHSYTAIITGEYKELFGDIFDIPLP